jgi:hypothetical protein
VEICGKVQNRTDKKRGWAAAKGGGIRRDDRSEPRYIFFSSHLLYIALSGAGAYTSLSSQVITL